MCCCKKPTLNGQPGYVSTFNQPETTCPIVPPELRPDDQLLHDLPGRCGRGVDLHCHHFCIVKQYGLTFLLTRSGLGTTRFPICARLVPILAALSEEDLFHTCYGLYKIWRDSERAARDERNDFWRKAAAERRIKVGRRKRDGTVQVTVEPTYTSLLA